MVIAEQFVSVTINGEARQIPGGVTVGSLLTWLEIPADRVAVEVNRAIVRKRDWARSAVSAGAQVEIVEFVGGG